ncbi:thioredoxin [Patescibacteria group bacterium]|nr:thioredoxin [Patescibacteria group bacterium]
MPSINLTDQNFEEEIKNAKTPVLVDFYALWCEPCHLMAPILEKIAKDYEGKIILAKVNLDSAPFAAQKYRIDSIPAVILFKEGKPVSGFTGVRPESVIKEWLEKMLIEDKNEEVVKLIKEYEEYAKENGFSLNPNRGVAEKIVNGLLEREKKFSGRYCPCRRITGNLEEDKKIICPCFWHREEIEKDGHCLCRLFVK